MRSTTAASALIFVDIVVMLVLMLDLIGVVRRIVIANLGLAFLFIGLVLQLNADGREGAVGACNVLDFDCRADTDARLDLRGRSDLDDLVSHLPHVVPDRLNHAREFSVLQLWAALLITP